MAEYTVTVTEEQTTTASTTLSNPITLETFDNVGDVDMSTNGKVNGSVLVYNTGTAKWTSTQLLENQTMEGGEF